MEQIMPWFEVTTIDGHKLYINSDEMVYMAPFQWTEGEGARLVTTTTDKDGSPLSLPCGSQQWRFTVGLAQFARVPERAR